MTESPGIGGAQRATFAGTAGGIRPRAIMPLIARDIGNCAGRDGGCMPA